MSKSIASSIYRAIFINGAIGLFVVITAVWFGYEDLERTWMEVDLQEEVKLLHEHAVMSEPRAWNTRDVTALYVPTNGAAPVLPPVFDGIPIPFAGPRDFNGEHFQVVIQLYPEGTYYLARNITTFKKREHAFKILLIGLAFSVLALNFVLSQLQGRRLVQPLRQLTLQIRRATSQSMAPVDRNFQEAELEEIASAINGFITEIDAFVQRERNLLNLASHELRTPITVISGAVQVIEQRGSLNPEDQKTLSRIRLAANEMQDNVASLLKLARQARSGTRTDTFSVAEVLDELSQEMSAVDPVVAARVEWNFATSDRSVSSDRTLAKMLIRNLLQNALQHATGTVHVTLHENHLDIRDHGLGLPRSVQSAFSPSATASSELEGLGLFIVSLICEQIAWQVDVVDTNSEGTCLRINFYQAA